MRRHALAGTAGLRGGRGTWAAAAIGRPRLTAHLAFPRPPGEGQGERAIFDHSTTTIISCQQFLIPLVWLKSQVLAGQGFRCRNRFAQFSRRVLPTGAAVVVNPYAVRAWEFPFTAAPRSKKTVRGGSFFRFVAAGNDDAGAFRHRSCRFLGRVPRVVAHAPRIVQHFLEYGVAAERADRSLSLIARQFAAVRFAGD